MGRKNKKKFLDKKKSVTFSLVHRSQRDPLFGTDANERVLVEHASHDQSSDGDSIEDEETRREKQEKYGILFDDDYNYLQHLRDVDEIATLEPIEERFRISASGEAMSLDPRPSTRASSVSGVGSSKLKLSSTLFETPVELETGVLERLADTGMHLDWDPDVMAALDDDFNFEDPVNELEDDFLQLADGALEEGEESMNVDTGEQSRDRLDRFFKSIDRKEGMEQIVEEIGDVSIEKQHVTAAQDAIGATTSSSEDSDTDDDDETISNEEDDEFPDELRELMEAEETKSRFTEYSLTSSVMARNKGLQLVDTVFEKFYEQYDEDEIGELDDDFREEPIKGHEAPGSQRLAKLAERFKNVESLKKFAIPEPSEETKDVVRFKLEKVNQETGSELIVEEKDLNKEDKWDCESILSTYSNLYNHPTLIKEKSKSKPKKRLPIDPKTGLPAGVLHSKALDIKHLDVINGDSDTRTSVTGVSHRSKASTIRPKGETPEDRAVRKKLVKEERKERRTEKKANKTAFKDEAHRINCEKINVNTNLNGLKLL